MKRFVTVLPMVVAVSLWGLSGLLPASAQEAKTEKRFSSSDAPPNWPQFRGTNGSGVAAGKDSLPTHFGPDQNVLWKTPVPSGVSSPCIWGDRVFLTCFDKENQRLETLCVERSSGKILWRHGAPAEQFERVHEVSSPANSTPATDGERVYVYFASCGLLCYDFDGHELWNKAMPLVQLGRYGNGASPIVVDDKVILNLDERGKRFFGRSNARVVAVRCQDGQTIWKTPRPGNGNRYTTPALWRRDGGDQIMLIGGGRLTGYDLATGEKVWWVDVQPQGVKATPLVEGDHVFVMATGAYGEPEAFVGIPSFEEFLKLHDKDLDGLVALEEIPKDLLVVDRRASYGAGNSPLKQFARWMDRDRDKKITKEEWEKFSAGAPEFLAVEPSLYSIRLGGEGDVSETHIEWRQTRGVSEVPTPLLYKDRLYIVRNGGIVHCRDPQNGRQLFRGRLGSIGGYYASPVAGDGKIYFASDRGIITVLAASDKLKVLANNDLEERIIATPALVDGKIYVRTDGYLYAFGG